MENFNYPPIGRYINLMFDRGFKRVFGKPANKDILIAFLNEVISNNVIPGPDPGNLLKVPEARDCGSKPAMTKGFIRTNK